MISHIPIPGMPDRASELQKFIPTLEQIEARPSPRVIKSHLPLYLLHPKLLDTSKVITKMTRFLYNFKESILIIVLCLVSCLSDCLRCSKSKRRHCFLFSSPQAYQITFISRGCG